jgi:hypothetical protein
LVEDLQGQVEQPQQFLNKNLGALEATGFAALLASPSLPQHAVYKPTVQPALPTPIHTPTATPTGKPQNIQDVSTPIHNLRGLKEDLSTQLVEIRFHVRLLQDLAAAWASELGGQAAAAASDMLSASNAAGNGDTDQAQASVQLHPSFLTPRRQQKYLGHGQTEEASAGATWVHHTLEDIQAVQASVVTVLHACLRQAAPAALALLQADEPLASRLAHAAAAEHSKVDSQAGAQQHTGSQDAAVTADALAQISARCSDYEAQLAALHQQLAQALESEEAAKQDAFEARSALEAERHAVSAAHEQLEGIRRELATAAQLQYAAGSGTLVADSAQVAGGSSGASPAGEGGHISREERRVQALEAQQAFVAHLQVHEFSTGGHKSML